MAKRTLTITLGSDWKSALRKQAGAAFTAGRYQGEKLNFETAGAFFGQLTERRWALVHALQGAGELSVRELARRVSRDVKRVHEDAAALAALGLIEKTDSGGVVCPFSDIHVDMHVTESLAA